MRNSALVLAALALASAGVAPCLHAQTLQGQVVDTVTGTPVGTGFVVLLGADDTEFYRTLTTRDGHFTFRLSPYHRGPFRLRSERIGYRVSVTDWFHVSSEDTRNLIIRVSALPVPLSAIEVRESTECKVRPTEDEQTAVVWEEARKALAAASWTALQQLYHVVSNLYDRDMDGRRRRVRQEHHRPSIGLSSMPFVARAPIELLQNGFTGPFQLRTGHAVDIEFPIRPSTFGLEPITVTGKPAVPFLSTVGFYKRQRAGFGIFLDREAIEKRAGASELGHLLQAIPGVRVDANGLIRLRGIGAGPDGTPCHLSPPLVFIDGFRIEPVEMGAEFGLITPNSWTRAIHPIHIEAIEVYRTPAEIPAQYNTGGEAACGVILIWTRRGGY